MDLLPEAGIVLGIKEDGTLSEQRGADLLSLPENGAAPTASISNGDAAHFHGSEEGQAPVKSKTASPGSAVEKSRRNGNLSLYAYLFRSAGPIMLSAWIFSTAFASVGEKVPSKLLFSSKTTTHAPIRRLMSYRDLCQDLVQRGPGQRHLLCRICSDGFRKHNYHCGNCPVLFCPYCSQPFQRTPLETLGAAVGSTLS